MPMKNAKPKATRAPKTNHRPRPHLKKYPKGSFNAAVTSFFKDDGNTEKLLDWHRERLIEQRWEQWDQLVASL